MPEALGGRLPSPFRHYGGFLLAGLLALTTDGLILESLMLVGWHPMAARPIAIAIAMVVSWLVNRRVTFAAPGRPSWREYTRFAAVAWSSQVVNYAAYVIILIVRPATPPLLALVLASSIAMFVSYFGYRYGVFFHAPAPSIEDRSVSSTTES